MLELSNGDARLVVLPDNGGRLASLSVGDLELLRTAADDPGRTHWGAFVMAPWAGRTRRARFRFAGAEHHLPRNAGDHAIHGTVRDQPWTIVATGDHSARLTCAFGERWPFPGHAEHTMTLHHDRLELELALHADREPMPAIGGWHPWWRRRLERGEPALLDLPARTMLRRDDDGIATYERLSPVPDGPWDDCFTDLVGPPRLRWEGALELTIESDCEYVVVYDEPMDSLCVEPQSAPPDALNHQPAVAEPGSPVVVHSSWRWSR